MTSVTLIQSLDAVRAGNEARRAQAALGTAVDLAVAALLGPGYLGRSERYEVAARLVRARVAACPEPDHVAAQAERLLEVARETIAESVR